nr:ATP12 family protein [uncultured Lichenicoccus sp.]
MSGALRRRFWEHVSVAAQGAQFAVFLDHKPLRLPGGNPLLLPTARLAAAVAEEWRLAGGGPGAVFGPEELVLTRLAGSLQEHVAVAPAEVAAALLSHAGTDLLCYRAAEPRRLAEEQAALWQPWLDRLERRHGIRLLMTSGVMPIVQNRAAMERLGALLRALPPATLAGLGAMVPDLGSLVLGLAVVAAELEPALAVELARLEQTFQARLWGADAANEAETRRLHVDVALAARFVTLAGSGDG